MNWHTMLARDNKAILSHKGVPITLYSPEGRVYETSGRVVRVDSAQDPQTGQMVYEPSIQISVHAADLPEIPKKPNGWIFETTDVYGNTLLRYIIDVRNDRTIGFVTIFGESYDGDPPMILRTLQFAGIDVQYKSEDVKYAG